MSVYKEAVTAEKEAEHGISGGVDIPLYVGMTSMLYCGMA